MRTFSIATQRSLEPVERVVAYPAREFPADRGDPTGRRRLADHGAVGGRHLGSDRRRDHVSGDRVLAAVAGARTHG